MKNLIKIISTTVFALAIVVSSCEKTTSGKESGGAKAAKINIDIQKYYNELGTLSLKIWEAGDKVAAFNADNADPVLGYGSPITTGAQTSLFTIAVTSVENGDNIMAYYPSSADVTPVSGGLRFGNSSWYPNSALRWLAESGAHLPSATHHGSQVTPLQQSRH